MKHPDHYILDDGTLLTELAPGLVVTPKFIVRCGGLDSPRIQRMLFEHQAMRNRNFHRSLRTALGNRLN